MIMSQPTEHFCNLQSNNPQDTGAAVNLCWFEWGAEFKASGTLLLVHATGFHARCWDQTIAHLPGQHVIAVDMRGHGRSENKGPITWANFGNDLVGFIQALDLHDLVAAGHSMGGYCLAHAAAYMPERFLHLVLVDPVILEPETYTATDSLHSNFLDEQGRHPVARRRNHFDDADAMYANFTGRGTFALWQDAVLRDYCNYGLQPAGDGVGAVLACPPDIEAAVYMGSGQDNIYAELPKITMPVTVMRAKPKQGPRTEMDFSVSPTYPGLAALLPNARDVYLPEISHFMPMQDPALVAGYIKAALDSVRDADSAEADASVGASS